MMTEYGLGWLPDIPSITDYSDTHKEVAPILARTTGASRLHAVKKNPGKSVGAAAAAIPPAAPGIATSVDLRAYCSPIEDQGALGSCTANAAAGLVEYFEKRAFGKYIDASRLFIYKATRDLLGWTGDTGAYLRSTMGALALFGAPPEKYWPYQIAKFDVEPSAFCYAFAENYKSIRYFRLDPGATPAAQVLQNIKSYLSAGFPSMFGFPVYDEYMHIAPSGIVPLPSPGSKLYGGHANVAVGYDDNLAVGADKGALLVRNSWGAGWGLHGYAWLSYRYVTEALAVDWWSVVSEKWVDTGNF